MKSGIIYSQRWCFPTHQYRKKLVVVSNTPLWYVWTLESRVSSYFYSRSYAEDVTSVTSGASQGPHSFNLVFVCLFVCLFVCVTPGAIPYLSVLYRTSKDSWPQYFCVFVPSTCLALSRTCPVPSRVRYHQENKTLVYMRSVSGECIQCSNILCGFVCEAEIPLAGWLGHLSTCPGIACRRIA